MRNEKYPSGAFRPITYGAYSDFKRKKRLASIFRQLFLFFFALIIVFSLVSCKIYYWCFSPDCFALWTSVLGFTIKIGGMK
jgi:hypothetical protein